jgi:tight adherence protein B
MQSFSNASPIAILMIVACVTGLFYALAYPYLSGDAEAERRLDSVAARKKSARSEGRAVDAASRRKQIADSLKEVEARQRSTKLSIDQRIAQSGLAISKQQFFIFCAGAGVGMAALIAFLSGKAWLAPAGLLIGAVGLPLWALGFMRARRINKFVEELPNAMDIIVRGVKSGLPLGDCLRIIASESQEPVRGEFRTLVEQQALGLTLPEAADRMAQRVPVTEANFFAIVINIQTKAGGNLSEALGNLSRVLRERKKMRGKIAAMSMEAKASAAIIGALPFIVAILIYLTAPNYMSLLFTKQAGQVAIAGSLCVMFVGVMVMRNMIKLDI